MDPKVKDELAIADRRAQCGLPPEEPPVPRCRIGEWYMPEGGPVASSVRVVAVEEKGLRVRRVHVSYGGEEFFLTWEAWGQSKWRPVPEGTQLAFV